MEVHFAPDVQARIDEFVSETGRAPDQLLEDAITGHFAEIAATREMLDGRYDDLESGRVKAIDGEAFFEGLHERENELLKTR